MNIRTLVVMGTVGIGLWITFAGQRSYAGVSAQDAVPHFLWTHWTTEDGLPQNSVVAIAETPDGYLWLGTFGGLARFDGVKFTIFNTGNTPALRSNRITALHVGRDGALWIGAETGEIARLHHDGFSFFARIPPDVNGDKTIRNIYEDRAGAVWVGAERKGVTRFVAGDPARAEFYDERHGLPGPSVNGVCEDRDGRLWVVTPFGLALFREGQAGVEKFTTQLMGTAQNHLLKIRPHPDGGLWLLTQTALNRYHDGRLTPYLNIPQNINVFAPVTETAAGGLLFSYAADRIFQIPRQLGREGQVTIIESELEQSRFPAVNSLLEDREGNVWLGTIGDGLMRLRRRRVTMLNSAHGLPYDNVSPILQDAGGDIWIGTGQGLCRLSAGVVTTHLTAAPQQYPGASRVDALYEDRAGTLWIGRAKSLARYRDGSFMEYRLPEVGVISAIMEDRQQRLWLGAWKGLVRFQDGQSRIYRQSDGLINNDVRFIFEDRAGALWLGTPTGLSRFADGVFTNFTTAQGLSNNYVRAIHEDQDGALWLGTYGGGLNRLRDGRITHITTKQGLFDDFVSRILPGTGDDDDTFWLLGNRGIFQVSRRALNEVADGQRSTVTCVVYDKADGMDPSEGNGGFQPAGWRMRDGRLWFPTIRGVAVVDPSLTSPLAPPVVIERVLLDGAELDISQPIEIPPGKGNLEIHYTGLSLGKAEQVQFSFQLRGLNEQWVDVGRRRTAYFPQLQPGRYTFSIKAFSPDGVWSARAASLDFVVRPPFWRTAWFLSLAATCLVGLALLGYRQRVTQLRRRVAQQETFARQLIASQERDRQRIAAELHDGLGQSLVIIKRRALLCLDAPADHERTLEQVQEIAEASTHALDEVKEIIFDLRPQQLDRLGLTGAITDLLAKAAAVHKLELVEELDDIDGLFAKEAENSFYRIVQESLNNVARHAAATRVAATLSRQPDSVKLVIQDNGRGFVVSAQHNAGGSFGLRGIRERARLLGGQAVIESAPGEGTTVWLSLPLKEQHNAG
ncbi:MAG: ligand-binding sensor domain-containing protein [Blastocatellia bacterium]